MPSADRAGPATLISAGEGDAAEHYLVDAGRGVLMRLAATGLGAPNLTAVLITHLHSDHITDLNDVITTRWVMTFEETPLTIVGPVGTQQVVDHIVGKIGVERHPEEVDIEDFHEVGAAQFVEPFEHASPQPIEISGLLGRSWIC